MRPVTADGVPWTSLDTIFVTSRCVQWHSLDVADISPLMSSGGRWVPVDTNVQCHRTLNVFDMRAVTKGKPVAHQVLRTYTSRSKYQKLRGDTRHRICPRYQPTYLTLQIYFRWSLEHMHLMVKFRPSLWPCTLGALEGGNILFYKSEKCVL